MWEGGRGMGDWRAGGEESGKRDCGESEFVITDADFVDLSM